MAETKSVYFYNSVKDNYLVIDKLNELVENKPDVDPLTSLKNYVTKSAVELKADKWLVQSSSDKKI
jgi:hypothetical protein